MWYRRVLNIPVQNTTKVQLIEPLQPDDAAAGFRVTVLHAGAVETMYGRKVVLATGIQGGGEWHTPSFVRESLPRHMYAHTSESIDFDALKGKRVAILGGGCWVLGARSWCMCTSAGVLLASALSPCRAPCFPASW